MAINKIFEENAVEVVSAPEGFVIVSEEENLEDKAVVSFKFYSLRTHKLTPVPRDVYLRAKFGENYQKIHSLLTDYINYRVATLNDGRIVCVYPDSKAVMFAEDGEIVWQGEFKYKDHTPTGITALGQNIWVSFGLADTILRYNLTSMRWDLRIGSKNDEAFSRPEGLSNDGSRLIVCNSESRCIESVDTDNYALDQLYSFEEPVYQVVKSDFDTAVLLESGVYIL